MGQPGRNRRFGRLVAAACSLVLLAGFARAQDPPAPQTGGTRSAGAAALSDEQRAKLAELEAQIADAVARSEEWASRSAEYEEARVGAAVRLQEIEQEIAELAQRSDDDLSPGASHSELDAALLSSEQDLSAARRESAELEAEDARRAERRKRIPELLAAAKERLRTLLAELPAAARPGPLLDAREQLKEARRLALEREVEAYERELASYDARGQLLVKRIDRATLRIAAHEERVERLRSALTSVEQAEGERAAERARELLQETASLPPAVQDALRALAVQNAEFAEQRTGREGLIGQIDDVSRKLSRAESSVAGVEGALARLRAKVEAAGLSGSVGLLLRRQRSDAPDVGKYQRFVRMRQERIRSVQLQQLELQEQRRELADLDRVVADALTPLDGSLPAEDRARTEALLRELLETRRGYLDALISDHETYFQKLVDFDARQLELIGKTEELLLYIDERVLWMPSGSAVRAGLAADGLAALEWLFAPRFWGQLLRAALDALLSTPLMNGSVLLLLLAAWPLARRVRPRIRELGEAARDPGCTRSGITWEALGLSLVRVPWLPGLLGYLGWRIGVSPDATQFARCFAYGMGAAALFWISIEAPRQLLSRDGVADAHFGWDAGAVARLHRWLGRLLAVSVPAVFLIYVFEQRDEAAWSESIGLLLFVALMGVAAVFTHAGMREGGSLERIVRSGFPMSAWLWRLARYAAFAAPIFLALGALRGFYWTALRLAARYHFTLVLVLGLIVVFALGLRWSKLAHARAAEALELEREQLRAAQTAAGDGQALVEPLQPQLDLDVADLQTARLLRSGALLTLLAACWLIWADVLPAAGILREVQLWDSMQTVTVELVDASGETRLSSEEQLLPVTLANLFQALLIGLVTLLVARNLPGLIEIALPRSPGLGSGERYAFSTIAKYGATLLGAVLAFRALGAGWSNIQWLVAAVGLGLGFGLQEIFANFVSGLIILFERPIRVGDTVTVGDVSGTVTRIRIRATWITGFDRKELVVPNKEFVTGRLVNWSLSDQILRIDVPVGIAYGSDTELAMRVLRRVAAENRHALKEPEPQVLFLGFGDSSLNFELRVFSPDVAHMLRIRHELHMEVDRAFRAAGIEIAFPQRDLHLRSLPESALLPLAGPPATPDAS